ncbi:MAG: glycosyltransferase family 4 protein [Lachnospiraceae bacterium]|nr:glycosyltransferase family 4 protein [Lachnospiraceae bacterium]
MKILLVEQIAKVTYKYSYALANAIKKQGNEIVVAIDQKKDNEYCECEVVNLFNTDEKNISKISKIINYIKSYRKIYKMIKKDGYDIIHTQWLIFSPVDYYYLKKITKKTKAKLVVTIHDILPFNEKFYDFRYHKKVYEMASKIIVQAENNVKRFEELFPEMKGKEVMIPHGHFLDFGEKIDCQEARDYLKIDKNKKVLLFFGQIKKVKGIGILLQAFSKICEKHKDVLLVIAGSVWKDDFTQYQKIIDDCNMADSVRTDIRYIPDEEIKYYYSSADICMLPYLDVYQSGVVQLTYAYKKPVVATNIGAFKEVVIDNETGFMCEPNDVDSLAHAIEKALESEERYDAMGQAGYDYIKEKFSWDKIAIKVCEIYK